VILTVFSLFLIQLLITLCEHNIDGYRYAFIFEVHNNKMVAVNRKIDAAIDRLCLTIWREGGNTNVDLAEWISCN
jgi:hypothetical protein